MQFFENEGRKREEVEGDSNWNQKQTCRPQNIIPMKGQEEEIGSSECWFQTSGGQKEGGPATWCWGRSDCGPRKTWPAGEKRANTSTQRCQGQATCINKMCLLSRAWMRTRAATKDCFCRPLICWTNYQLIKESQFFTIIFNHHLCIKCLRALQTKKPHRLMKRH